MGQWGFNKTEAAAVRVEVTQRDQFNNDDVGLAEALVREAIQNSSDAGLDNGVVKVRFGITTISGSAADEFRKQLEPLALHFDACKLDFSALQAPEIRVLVIEDFNTKGLTGAFDQVDYQNFDSFWRAVGKSEKTGQSGGRWGLGKLVYSSSSRLRLFYGFTKRQGDQVPALMGQVVLTSHRIGDTFYQGHGFWFDKKSDHLGLQMPIQNEVALDKFRSAMGVSRKDQTGLSIAIPFLLPGIDEKSLLAGVVNNYYFPILAGKLVVEVGNTIIDKDSFIDVAEAASAASALSTPFGFVAEVSQRSGSKDYVLASASIGKSELEETHFSPENLAKLKESFAKGDLVHVRVPVSMRRISGAEAGGNLDLFLKALPESEKPFSLFARGPITLVGERRYFSGAMARGALIATDGDVAEFLGDAENPAHTAWNANAEKLAPKWKNPQATLAAIRHSLRALYGFIAENAEAEDSEALVDFFSLVDQAQASTGKKKKTSKPKIEIAPREKAISIRSRDGGFDIVAGPGAASWEYPRVIRVRMAYDMIGANPFTRHSRYDFDLETKDIAIDTENADVEVLKANVLKVTAKSSDFQISARGFDERRDIVVDARAV